MRGNGYAARPPKGAPRGRQAAARGSPFAQVKATASQRRSPDRASSGGERSGGGRIGWRLSAFAVSSEEKCRGRHRSERRRPEREAVPQESELRRLDPEVAPQALEPQAALLADADPIGLIDAMTDLSGALARTPLAPPRSRCGSIRISVCPGWRRGCGGWASRFPAASRRSGAIAGSRTLRGSATRGALPCSSPTCCGRGRCSSSSAQRDWMARKS